MFCLFQRTFSNQILNFSARKSAVFPKRTSNENINSNNNVNDKENNKPSTPPAKPLKLIEDKPKVIENTTEKFQETKTTPEIAKTPPLVSAVGWKPAIVQPQVEKVEEKKPEIVPENVELSLEDRVSFFYGFFIHIFIHSCFQVKKLEELVACMKSNYEFKLENLQKELAEEKVERKRLEEELRRKV